MREISDELLMAYADRELPMHEWRRVDEAVRKDPALQRRLTEFLGTGRNLADLFDPILRAPLPEGALRVIDRALPPSPPAHRRPAGSAPRAERPARSRVREWLGIPAWSVAALPLLFAGGWLAHAYLGPQRTVTVERIVTVERAVPAASDGPVTFQDGRYVISPALRKALSVTPRTGSVVLQISPAITVVPDSVFRSIDHRWCRSYALTYATGAGAWGIACRPDKGGWEIDFQTSAPGLGHRTTVAGTEPQSLQGARDRLMLGRPTQPSEELELIQGWSP